MEKKIYDLEDRLVVFAARIIDHVDNMPGSVAGRYYGGQLLRSGGSPALHYGEGQSAESTKDFIHKCSIAHKELKESRINLRIQTLSTLARSEDPTVRWLTNECEELIKILGKIISNKKKQL